MNPRVVLLNDTSSRYHHGCTRVMRLLTAGIERQGLTITHRSAARHQWENDPATVAALEEADLIVINGEGTLHHGKPAGAELLKVALHPARQDTPVALVNALYEHNPDDWGRYLAEIDLISARDARSAQALSDAASRDVGWLPDLSLTAPADVETGPRHGTIVGDSVKWNMRQCLARIAAQTQNVTFVPTKSLRQRIWHAPFIGTLAKSALYRVYNGYGGLRTPPFEMPQTDADYLALLAQAELHITGRFHAVCLSMLTETPFLALRSNASKIERLLQDAGLSPDRMIDPEQRTIVPADYAFSQDELAAMRMFRTRAAEQAEALFARLAVLARTGRP